MLSIALGLFDMLKISGVGSVGYFKWLVVIDWLVGFVSCGSGWDVFSKQGEEIK
jgi:hypothetical protein